MSGQGMFVLAAYGVSAVGLAGLMGWILWDGFARRRELLALDRSGVRRRSDRKAAAGGP